MSGASTLFAAAFAAAVLVTSAHVAWAAPPAKPVVAAQPSLSDSLTGDAKADYESAKVYFNDQDFSRAYLKFQSAYEKSHDPRLLWNMAACQKEQRKYAKVVPLVEQYVKERGASLTPDEKSNVDALLQAIKPGTTTVRVDVSETDADVYLDDELLGKSPLATGTLVDLGVHKLRVHKTGFDDFDQTVNAGGEAVAVAVKLTQTIHEGRLLVKAGKEDAISIDGKVVGQGIYSDKLPSGSHVLRVSAPGMRPYQGDVVVVDNETREIPVALDRAETKVVVPTWIWYTLAGVAVVVGAGVIIGVAAKQDSKYEGPAGTLPPGSVDLSKGFGLRF